MSENASHSKYLEALELFDLKQYEKAIPKLVDAVADDPSNRVVLNALGQAYYLVGRYTESVSKLEQVLSTDYENNDALRWIGFAHHQMCDYERAVYYYLRSLDIQEDPNTRVNLGNLYLYMGEQERAMEQFDVALLSASDDPDVHFGKGQTCLDMGRFDEGIAFLRNATERDPTHSSYQLALANALTVVGRHDEAERHYIRASELAVTAEERALAQDGMASSLEERRLWTQALRHRLAERKGWENIGASDRLGEIDWNLGWIYFKINKYEGALAASRRAIKFKKDWSPVHFNSGLTLLHMGRSEEADREYHEGLRDLKDLSDLNTHGINDLREALINNPELAGGKDILEMLEIAKKEFRSSV